MPRTAWIFPLMFLSGFAGLGYEMLWIRSLTAGLGHEIVSVLAVVAAFFVGNAAGAALLDRPIRHSRRPGRWYAFLELIIAAWALALTVLAPRVAPLGAALMGEQPSMPVQWGVTFIMPLILLLPATMAMGATLPAIDAFISRLNENFRWVGGIYGANTLGAVTGTLATTFWIAPAIGFSHSQYLLAVVNLVCAAIALRLIAGSRSPSSERDITKSHRSDSLRRLYLTLFLTGLLGIGYEVMTVRILSQVLENTVFSYAILLAIYLFGTAAGAFIYQRLLLNRDFAPHLAKLLVAQAITCAVGVWVLHLSPSIYQALAGLGFHAAESGVALSAFGAPTIVMGALFSHLAQAVKDRVHNLGSALAINTLGGALAPCLFGIVLLPAWGPVVTMAAICSGYLLLLGGFVRTVIQPAAIGAIGIALTFTFVDSSALHGLAAGETVVAHRPGTMAAVTVIRDARKDCHLKINGHYQMGGTASRYSDERQTHIPLLLHPDPSDVLFLGLGTGTTFAASGVYRDVAADGVELIPEVIPLMNWFVPPEKNAVTAARHIFAADARRFVLAGERAYDVIIADLFHPSRDGAGFLYTREHFNAVKKRLSADGIFCQWLPLYQMDLDMLRLIVRTFLDVFPQGTAFIAHHSLTQPIIGLVGGRACLRIDPAHFRRRLTDDEDLAKALRSVGLTNSYTLLGCYLAGPRQLRQFAGDGPLNTDDHPIVVFKAPSFVYEKGPAETPVRKLMALIQSFTPDADDILITDATDAERSRLAAYWKARDAYLQTGAGTPPHQALADMVRVVAGPLLAVVRTSPDFESAYRPLLIMANRLHPSDPQRAEQLLADLESAAPHRPETAYLRRQWADGG